MKPNAGSADRIVRVVIAIVAVVLAFVVGFGSAWAWVLLAVGAIMLVTAAVGFCPLYTVFRINTCKTRS